MESAFNSRTRTRSPPMKALESLLSASSFPQPPSTKKCCCPNGRSVLQPQERPNEECSSTTGGGRILRHVENWSTRVQAWCDRLATEDNMTHMLSLFGNDSEMAAVSGAISTGSRLTAKLPDGTRLELNMGEKPTRYRGHLAIPGRLRPVRHILCFSEATHAERHSRISHGPS
jgi:hypothetical protein